MIAQRLGLPKVRGGAGFLVALLIDTIGSGLFAPVSLLYFHLGVGLPLPTVGVAFTLATAAALPVALLTGVLVERLGARRTVIAGEMLQGAGFLLYLIVRDLPSLIAAAFFAAAGLRLFWSAFFPLVSEIATVDERDRWFGLAGSAQSAGAGIGGLLAGGLLALGGVTVYRIAVAVDGVSFLLAAGVISATVHEARQTYVVAARSGSFGVLLRDRPFVSLIATNVAFCLCGSLLGTGLPVYAVEVLRAPGSIIGVLFAMSTIAVAVAQTVTVRLLEPYRRTRALIGAGALWAAWCLVTALTRWVPPSILITALVIGIVLYTLAEMIHAPTSQALAAAASPEVRQGYYLAAYQFSWAVSLVIAPVLFTSLFVVDPVLPWLGFAMLVLAGAGILLLLEPHLPPAAVRPGRPRKTASR
jgi:MFS family permease